MRILEDSIRQFTVNAQAVDALLRTIPDEQALWKPNPETWSLKEVMEHVYNEERLDFRQHLKEMFSRPPQPWGEFNPQDYVAVENCRQALENFLFERKTSIDWLAGQASADWNASIQTPFDTQGGLLVLSAGDVLTSWVAHDYLHLRQINELLYAWNEKQAAPFSVQYAGGW